MQGLSTRNKRGINIKESLFLLINKMGGIFTYEFMDTKSLTNKEFKDFLSGKDNAIEDYYINGLPEVKYFSASSYITL